MAAQAGAVVGAANAHVANANAIAQAAQMETANVRAVANAVCQEQQRQISKAESEANAIAAAKEEQRAQFHAVCSSAEVKHNDIVAENSARIHGLESQWLEQAGTVRQTREAYANSMQSTQNEISSMQRSHAMQNADRTAQNEALAQSQSTLLAEVQELRNFVASKQPPLGPLQHIGFKYGQFEPDDVNDAVNARNQHIQHDLEGFGHWTSGFLHQDEADAYLAQHPNVAKRLFDSPGEMARPTRPSTIEESEAVANAGGHGHSLRGKVATNSGATANYAAGGTTAGDRGIDHPDVPSRDISRQRDQAQLSDARHKSSIRSSSVGSSRHPNRGGEAFDTKALERVIVFLLSLRTRLGSCLSAVWPFQRA